MAKDKGPLRIADIKTFGDAVKFIETTDKENFQVVTRGIYDDKLYYNNKRPYMQVFFNGLVDNLETEKNSGYKTFHRLMELALTTGNVDSANALTTIFNDTKVHTVAEVKATLAKGDALQGIAKLDAVRDIGQIHTILDFVAKQPGLNQDTWAFLKDSVLLGDQKNIDYLVRKVCEAGNKEALYDLQNALQVPIKIGEDDIKAAIENNRHDFLKEILLQDRQEIIVDKSIQNIVVSPRNEAYALFLTSQVVAQHRTPLLRVFDDKIPHGKAEGSQILYNTLQELGNFSGDAQSREVLEGFAKKLASEGYKLSKNDFQLLGIASNKVVGEVEAVQSSLQDLQTSYLTEAKSLYGKFQDEYKKEFKDLKDPVARNESARAWLAKEMKWCLLNAISAMEPGAKSVLQSSQIESLFSQEDLVKSVLKDKDIDRLMDTQKSLSGLQQGFLIFLSAITLGLIGLLYTLHTEHTARNEISQLSHVFDAALQSEYSKITQPTWVMRTEASREGVTAGRTP